MSTRLIVPGLNGSGEGHWQDFWLKDDPDSILVEQRDWQRPDLLEWVVQLEAALTRHPGAIVIAHSIGAVVAAGLACRTSRHLVGGALLVAPCDLARVASLHPPVFLETQALRMRTLPFPSTVIASRNDPYMPIAQARELAATLGSEFTDIGHAGHINIASGYGRWRRGYRLAARLERHSYGTVAGALTGRDNGRGAIAR
jgi:predicted alpha/beta hydrolase family esterase